MSREAPPAFSETAFHDAVSRFADILECRMPKVGFSPPSEIRDHFDAVVLEQYRHGFFAFHVRKDGEAYIYVDTRSSSRLSGEAVAALAAHETAHAADYLMAWRQSALARILPHGLHRRIEWWAEPAHERFANRAAAHLVGAESLHRLHVEASALMGHPAGDADAPDMGRGLPPSLRLGCALRRMIRRTGAGHRSVAANAGRKA